MMMVASLGMLGACKQGVGDRCQVQSDCDDGLLCVLPAGGTPQSGGTCQMSGAGLDMTTSTDMTASTDMTSAPDMTVPVDMVPTDL
jgi:hypothetical protein